MTTVAQNARTAYGDLPEGWTRRRLRFDVRLNPKKSSLEMEPDELVSFVPMDAIGEYGGLNLDDVRELEDVYDGYTYFADGDLCVAKITPCFENGKGALAEGLTNGVGFGTTELHVVRPGPDIDRRFLFYVSIADDFRKFGESEMYGAGGQKRIDENFIKDWLAPLPPLDTQRRIAQFLDEKTARIDGLIEKKRALLNRLAEKRQALITHAVTKGLDPDAPMKPSGIDWLGDIPAHWELIQLKFMTSKIGSGVTPRGGASVYVESGVMLLRSQNIHFEGLALDDVVFIDDETDNGMSETRVRCGDVLLNITGASIGRCCLFDQVNARANVNQHVCIIRPSKQDADFVGMLLTSSVGQVQIDLSQNGASREGLNFGDLGNFVVPSPPIFEQKAIVQNTRVQVEAIGEQSSHVLQSIDTLQEYRSALVTAAVTGQIRGLC